MDTKIKIEEILISLYCIQFEGNRKMFVSKVIQMDDENTNEEALFWCSDKNLSKLINCQTGVVICSMEALKYSRQNKALNYIFVKNPRHAFALVVEKFFVKKKHENFISKSAIIHNTVKIGKNVFIGENVVVEENVEIGDNTTILHGTVILYDVKIGSNVKIGINNSIGGNGLGYVKDENDLYKFIPHVGSVIICDNVETGSGCAIDRAVLGFTKIDFNSKLDNLVHVAHGVVIGKNCILTANVMIAGSTIIEDNVWIGPSSALMNKIRIGKNAFIGLGSVVIKDVASNTVVAGNPAKFIRQNS